MSKYVDRRKKLAGQDGQEYAHIYPFEGKNEEYQYQNEEQRVVYHAKDPDDVKTTEELYNVQTEQINSDTQTGTESAEVKFDAIRTVVDHRQRSYRIKNKPQIYDKSDPGSEAYSLQNDPREDEVNKTKESVQNFQNQISQEQNVDLTSPNGRFGLDQLKQEESSTLEVGDNVEDSEIGLKGKIAFVGRNVVSIIWSDNTRERMSSADASKFLKKSYVDAAQEQVDPLDTPQFPKNELEEKVSNALSSLESEEIKEDDKKIDIDKIRLQRKVNELEAQVKEIDIQKIKEKAAREIVDLMQKKGMLGNSTNEVELQMTAIMAMNDEAFESYKNAIVGTKNNVNEVAEIEALLGDDDYSDIEDGQEYAKAKETMKKATKTIRSADGIEMGDTSWFENGGLANFKGNVGDFSSHVGSANSSNTESRKLSQASEDSKNRKTIKRKADAGLDLSNFKDLQGLTTPINIPNKEMNAGSKFADLFSDLGWSGLPKKGSGLRR